jgi:intracellular sulfur oxidation DsrE/DsrF family protein
MKKIIFLTAFMLSLCNYLVAQKAPYKVVFDVTSKDSLVHQMVIRWIREIETTNPEAEIEVVFYAKSLGMVTKDKSVVAADVIKYAKSKNVTFKVCEVAMKNNSIEKGQLLEGVGIVPDGIYEIVSKQHEGWGYIKAAQ